MAANRLLNTKSNTAQMYTMRLFILLMFGLTYDVSTSNKTKKNFLKIKKKNFPRVIETSILLYYTLYTIIAKFIELLPRSMLISSSINYSLECNSFHWDAVSKNQNHVWKTILFIDVIQKCGRLISSFKNYPNIGLKWIGEAI